MKNTTVLIVVGAALAGAAYNFGYRLGHNECLYKCQKALLEGLAGKKKEEES